MNLVRCLGKSMVNSTEMILNIVKWSREGDDTDGKIIKILKGEEPED